MYRVIWEIDIDAETPEDAARQALTIQRDPNSIATVFEVADLNMGPPDRNGDWPGSIMVDLTTGDTCPAHVTPTA